jgi:hypothetical protein
MAASGFTVACLSNTCKNTYPGNVGSHYTVKLPKVLNFSSGPLNEGASRWEVAMMDCHYLHNFYNFREGCTLHIIIEKPQVRDTNTSEVASPTCIVLNRKRREYLVSDLHRKLVSEYFLNLHDLYDVSKIPEALLGVVRLPASNYSSISALLNRLVSGFNTLFYPRYKLRLHARISGNGTISFSTSNGKAPILYAETPYIAKVLGLDTKEMTLDVEPGWGWDDRRVTLHELALVGTRTPKLDRVQALYIYGDIIDHQYVGSTMAPLLGYVDVPDSLGERVSHTCNPLVYLSVNRSVIDTITIHIRDERGNDVTFPDDVSNVILRLHFRESAV